MRFKIPKEQARGLLAAGERGQTLVEYALIISVISLGVVGAMTLLKSQLVQVFSDIVSAL
jgi:Flp pilus assembly pilin Flp